MFKTKERWDGSGKRLTDFLEIGDTVDMEIVDYMIGVLPPATMNGKAVQMGEPYDHDSHDRGMYITVEKKAGKWIYTGIKTRAQVK